MNRVLILFVAVCVGTVCVAAPTRPAPNAARIDAIAAHLPARSGAVGALPRDRAAWAPIAALPEAKDIIARATGQLGKPIAEVPDELYLQFSKGDGNRSRYESRYFSRRHNLDLFMLAEALEWKGRFLPEIQRYLEAILVEKAWTVPAHDGKLDCLEGRRPLVKLFSSQRCWTVAYAIVWYGDLLPADLVARAKAECRRRILDPYLVACRDTAQIEPTGTGWFFGNANWTAVCHLGCTASALMLIEDRRVRAECLEACERAMPYYFRGFTEDGYCSEGMAYWGYGYGSYAALVALARHYTGDFVTLLSDTPKAACVARYGTGFQFSKGLSPRFADGGGNPSELLLAEAVRLWPEAVPASDARLSLLAGGMANYGKITPCCAVDRRAFGRPAQISANAREDLPIRTVFPDAQVFVMRPATSAGLAFACKGGSNGEFHNHNDVGTYAISLDGVYMLGDLGPEPYTARTFSKRRYESDVLNSFGHGVPRVAGQLQPKGRTYAARVLKTELTDARDVVVFDLAKAYDCPNLQKLTRTVTYDHTKGVVTICDDVVFAQAASFDVPFIALGPAEKAGEGYRVRQQGKSLSVTAQVTGGDWHWQDDELKDKPGKVRPHRYAVQFDAPITQATVTFTFTPETH